MGLSISISKTTSANRLLNKCVVNHYNYTHIVCGLLWLKLLVGQILHLAKATKAYLVTDFLQNIALDNLFLPY